MGSWVEGGGPPRRVYINRQVFRFNFVFIVVLQYIMAETMVDYKEDIRTLVSMYNNGFFRQDHYDRIITRLRAEMVNIFGEDVTKEAFAEATALADPVTAAPGSHARW